MHPLVITYTYYMSRVARKGPHQEVSSGGYVGKSVSGGIVEVLWRGISEVHLSVCRPQGYIYIYMYINIDI